MLKKEEIFVNIQNESEYNKFTKLLRSFGQSLEMIGWDYMRCAHFYENSWCVPQRSYIEKLKTKVSIQELKNILAFEYLKKGDVIIFSGGTAGLLWVAEFERFIPNRGIDLPLSIKTKRHNSLHKESRYQHSASGEIHGSFVRFATDGEKRVLGVKTKKDTLSININDTISDSLIEGLSSLAYDKVDTPIVGENDPEETNDYTGLVKSINRLSETLLLHSNLKRQDIRHETMYYNGEKIESGSVIYINENGYPELYLSKEDFLNEGKINEEWTMKPQVCKKEQLIESLNDAYKSMSNSYTLDTMPVRSALSSVMDYITAMPDITTYDIAKIERLHDYLIDAYNIHPSLKQLTEAREVISKLSKYTDHE